MSTKTKTAALVVAHPAPAKTPSKITAVENLLLRESGTTIPEMCEATGWQRHTVRGAMAGTLKKRGLIITSDKIDGVRRYHASRG